jgi:hypothetical protein
VYTYHHYNFLCMYLICQMPIDHAFTWVIEIGNTCNSTMGRSWSTKFTIQKPCSSYHIITLPRVFKGINKHWIIQVEWNSMSQPMYYRSTPIRFWSLVELQSTCLNMQTTLKSYFKCNTKLTYNIEPKLEMTWIKKHFNSTANYLLIFKFLEYFPNQ